MLICTCVCVYVRVVLQLYGGETPAGGILHPGPAIMAPRPAVGAPGATHYPPQILSAAPIPTAAPQFVVPMPVTGATLHSPAGLHTPVYNVIGGPTFGAPVYLSHYDYAASAGSGVAGTGMGPTATGPDVMPVSDGSSLLTTTAAGTGSRFFHTTVATGSGPRTAGGGGGLLSAAGGGAAPHSGGGMTSGAEMLTGQHLTVFGQAAGGPGHHGTHRGGGGGGAAGGPAGLLPAGTLMMDAEGGLYTYTMDG
ncbi:hypothetical protein Vretifemale_20221 [Volvox reticuliferus]|uniref:Uncharacterized protein n=1 Tax=Volvox reticuliferus TaxID=1737510 RepID=A0A8J4CZF8_9CHLO|nr:hypothetical protein Vretifemale_20221 [Volvox reticuliferus]